MRFKTKLFILFFVFIFTMCSDRDRTNPLDPQNEETQGRPTGLNVKSRENQVLLSWNALSFKDLSQINIYRQSHPDSDYVLIGKVEPGQQYYLDSAVEYGITYTYRITIQADSYESPPSNSVTTRPGPTYTWVTEGNRGTVSLRSHDLQSKVMEYGFLTLPYRVKAMPGLRTAWVYSRYSNKLLNINHQGRVFWSFSDIGQLTEMSVDTSLNRLWYSIKEESRIVLIGSNGNILASSNFLKSPSVLVADSDNHTCWVLDDYGKRIYLFNRYAQAMTTRTPRLQAPKDFVINELDKNLWVADGKRVVQLDYSGKSTDFKTKSFYNAAIIAYNHTENTIWVVDLQPDGELASLFKLSSTGNVLFELQQFGYPTDIAINEFDGRCILADNGAGYTGLWEISSDGSDIERISSNPAIYSISIEHH